MRFGAAAWDCRIHTLLDLGFQICHKTRVKNHLLKLELMKKENEKSRLLRLSFLSTDQAIQQETAVVS